MSIDRPEVRSSGFAAAVAVMLSMLAGSAIGARQERSTAGIRLQFTGTADLSGLSIHTFLTGPFGGIGDFVQTKPHAREYVVVASHEGRRGTELKAIVFVPGYQTVLISRRLADQGDDPVPVSLVPLKWIPLEGRVHGIADASGLSLEAEYHAYWSHAFFGIVDGAVPSFVVGFAPLLRDGSFALRIPDLVRDPSIAERSSFERGVLRFRLREVDTRNPAYSVELQEYAGKTAEVAVAARYPELTLVAVAREP